jgi:hypothetical protein
VVLWASYMLCVVADSMDYGIIVDNTTGMTHLKCESLSVK